MPLLPPVTRAIFPSTLPIHSSSVAEGADHDPGSLIPPAVKGTPAGSESDSVSGCPDHGSHPMSVFAQPLGYRRAERLAELHPLLQPLAGPPINVSRHRRQRAAGGR